MATPVRKALHAYLGDESYEAWHRFAEDYDVSPRAVLTALGLALSGHTEMTTGQKFAAVIARAKDDEREKCRARRKAIPQRPVGKAPTEPVDREQRIHDHSSKKPTRNLSYMPERGCSHSWHDFAAENGASVSAILELFAPALKSSSETAFQISLDEVIKQGCTDAQRNRRRS